MNFSRIISGNFFPGFPSEFFSGVFPGVFIPELLREVPFPLKFYFFRSYPYCGDPDSYRSLCRSFLPGFFRRLCRSSFPVSSVDYAGVSFGESVLQTGFGNEFINLFLCHFMVRKIIRKEFHIG